MSTQRTTIRTMMDIIQVVGGRDVLFLATANRLDTLPPELQRRFNLGIWYFDVPTKDERAAIWKIQAKRYGAECKDLKSLDPLKTCPVGAPPGIATLKLLFTNGLRLPSARVTSPTPCATWPPVPPYPNPRRAE
jgi:hypothetical protein